MNDRHMAVIGNGIIGHGIAEVFAKAGWSVYLIGRAPGSLARAMERIGRSLGLFVQHGLLTDAGAQAALGRIQPGTDLAAAATASLVIEAVPEDMELKLALFGQLDALCPAEVVLASSSGHPASALDHRVRHKQRVLATHFWYPPQLLPLVEVCGSPATAPEVVAWACGVLRDAGKQPVVIDREVPGFIGNRIQFAALREAWSLWAAGVASAEAIDAVVRHSIGRRLGITGPIESADLGGLPVMVPFAQFLQPTLDTAALPPPALGTLAATPGATVHGLSLDRREALVEARTEELIRWLKADQAAARLPG